MDISLDKLELLLLQMGTRNSTSSDRRFVVELAKRVHNSPGQIFKDREHYFLAKIHRQVWHQQRSKEFAYEFQREMVPPLDLLQKLPSAATVPGGYLDFYTNVRVMLPAKMLSAKQVALLEYVTSEAAKFEDEHVYTYKLLFLNYIVNGMTLPMALHARDLRVAKKKCTADGKISLQPFLNELLPRLHPEERPICLRAAPLLEGLLAGVGQSHTDGLDLRRPEY